MDNLFNPLNPVHFKDPYKRLSEARQHCPVAEFVPGLVFVARDADVREVLKTPSAYSNVGNFELEGNNPPVVTQMDPPRHTQMRSLLQTALNTKGYQAAGSFIQATANQLLDAISDRRSADLMDALALPLPLIVLAHLIGVPEDESLAFRSWAAEINATIPHDFTHLESWSNFKSYIQEMINKRRNMEQPPDDLITRLMTTEIEGLKLKDDEIRMAIFQLIMAGSDSATFLLGNLIYELLKHPNLWQRVNQDRALIPHAIEESLRHDAPISWVMRTCKHAMTIEGVTIDEGKRTVLGLASANRDESVWENPDEFMLERPNINRHLAFGYGIHFCLGAELARLEARTVLTTLLDRFPGLHLNPDSHFEPGGGAMLRGPRQLNVVW